MNYANDIAIAKNLQLGGFMKYYCIFLEDTKLYLLETAADAAVAAAGD